MRISDLKYAPALFLSYTTSILPKQLILASALTGGLITVEGSVLGISAALESPSEVAARREVAVTRHPDLQSLTIEEFRDRALGASQMLNLIGAGLFTLSAGGVAGVTKLKKWEKTQFEATIKALVEMRKNNAMPIIETKTEAN